MQPAILADSSHSRGRTQHFHFPKHLTVDPVAILLGAVFVFAVWNMRGKRTANRKGGK